jgi:hypothetical protein
MRFTKSTITYWNNEDKCDKEVAAQLSDCGTFAIHKSINYPNENLFSVTHAKTGLHICTFERLWQAKGFCEEAKNLCDWSKFKLGKNSKWLSDDSWKYVQKAKFDIVCLYQIWRKKKRVGE